MPDPSRPGVEWSSLAEVVYALELGGSEMLASRLARKLNDTGRYRCSVFAIERDGPLREMLESEGIPARAMLRGERLRPGLVTQLSREFRRRGVRLVHTHHLGQLLYGGPAARLAGARLLHTEHEYYSFAGPRSRRLLRWFSRLADRVTGVTESVTQFLREQVGIPERKLETVRNGVDVGSFERAAPIDRSRLGLDERAVIVAAVGRLAPEKSYPTLVSAFQLLRSREPRARLLFIGEGRERGRLERMVRDRGLESDVRFLGERWDVPELLASSDLVALTSVSEGLPMSILEAMAAGKPVVCSRVGALAEVIRQGRNGILVQPQDVEGFAAAMTELASNPDKRRSMGIEARELVRTSYSFDATWQAYDELFRAMTQRRR